MTLPTVNDDDAWVRVVATGIDQLVYNFDFLLKDETEIVVYWVSIATDNALLLVLNTDYSSPTINQQNGGPLTLILGSVIPNIAIGDKIVMLRRTSLLRDSDYPTGGPTTEQLNNDIKAIFKIFNEQDREDLRALSLTLGSDHTAKPLERFTVGGAFLQDVGDPVLDQDAVTKKFGDDNYGGAAADAAAASAAAAAVDAVQTGLDVVATAADRVQTGLDATAASASAALAATAATGTSTTSLLIETASKVFTTQADKAWVVGSRVRAASDAGPSNYMEGIVTAYSGTSLTIDIDNIGGSGTLADWNLGISGDVGDTGAEGPQGPAGVGGIDDLTDGGTPNSTSVFLGHDGGSAGASDASNTAIGIEALDSLNNSGAVGNVAVGKGALTATTSGDSNVAVGLFSLTSVSSGSQNVAIGQSTLSQSNGSFNVAIGHEAGKALTGNSNILIGRVVGDVLTNVNDNVLIGDNVLTVAVSGSNNTALGTQALLLALSSNNIAIGWHVGNNLTSGANNIGIGYDLDFQSIAASGQLTIGNAIFATGLGATGTTIASANIGILETAPDTPLHIGSTSAALTFQEHATAPGTPTSGDAVIYAKSDGIIYAQNDAGLEIAMSNPKQQISAWVNFNGTGTVAIRDEFNVTSITDNGVGNYTINFTNNLADTNYAAAGMADSTPAIANNHIISSFTRAVGSLNIGVNSLAGLADNANVQVHIIGGD